MLVPVSSRLINVLQMFVSSGWFKEFKGLLDNNEKGSRLIPKLCKFETDVAVIKKIDSSNLKFLQS